MPGSTRKQRSVHVMLSDALVKEIDARAGQGQRSRFIEEAVEETLRRLRRVEAFKRILESPNEVGVPEWGTRESTSNWINNLRQEWDRATSAENQPADARW
jgi:hypothetical protein